MSTKSVAGKDQRMDQNSRETETGAGAELGAEATPHRKRMFGATRVRPRIEFGVPTAKAPQAQAALPGDDVDDGASGEFPGSRSDTPFGGGSDPFAPRSLAGGRVRVYGCSPGCIGASVVISLILTLLLNVLL